MQVQDDEITFRTYFESHIKEIKEHNSLGNYVLSSAHIGKSKEVLDLTELDLPVLSVISTFGHYVKFKVQSTAVSTNVVSTNSGVTNAYKILIVHRKLRKTRILHLNHIHSVETVKTKHL